jgi:hypothetical protein
MADDGGAICASSIDLLVFCSYYLESKGNERKRGRRGLFQII